MKRTPEERERLRRLLEENESARRDLQALLDQVETRIRARREERSWIGRVLGQRAASR